MLPNHYQHLNKRNGYYGTHVLLLSTLVSNWLIFLGLIDVTLTLEEAISKRVDVDDIDAENKLTTVMPIFRSWRLKDWSFWNKMLVKSVVYILKWFEVEETWSKFWDLCKNLWYDPKKGTLGKHSTLQLRLPLAMFSSLAHTNSPSQRYLSLIEINFRPPHLHLRVFVECFH